MSFVDLHGKRVKQLFEGVKAQVAWGDRLMLSLVTLESGSTVPMHGHPHEQAGVVLEGEFDFTIGQETRRVKAGDTYIIPGNVQHGCAACAGHALVLDIFSPVREEYKR
jgi:quercetin dioxygenase-like cupin family protein